MTNFPERDARRYEYMDSGNAPMWIIGLVAVVVLNALGRFKCFGAR
jgi:hypothetical protein